MKMLSINKSFISFNQKYSLLYKEMGMNTISTKIQKRFFRSKNSLNKLNELITSNRSTHLSKHLSKIRCFSTNKTSKVTDIQPFKRKTTEPTTRTVQPIKQLAEEKEEKEKKLEPPTVVPIGIVGIHKWEDMKNVKEWICFYHFPYIVQLGTAQRLKLWLTVINTGLVPISLALYSSGSVTIEVVATFAMISLFSMFAMYTFGHLLSRFVGRIYVSDDGKFVRLSHLSFFGRRVDDDIDREDIVPLVDSNHRINDWYCAIERYSTSSPVYMSLKFGGITNTEAFQQVFGEEAIILFNKNK